MAVVVPYFAFNGGYRFDRCEDELLEFGAIDIRLDVANRSFEITGNEVEYLPRHWRKATNAQVARDDDDGDLDAGEKIDEVAIDPAHFVVSSAELFVQRVELFVGRLELFLCGVELLVRALKFLVAGENLFVRRLELLVGRLEFLDDGLEIFPAGGQLALEHLHLRLPFAPPQVGRGLRRHRLRQGFVWFAAALMRVLKQHQVVWATRRSEWNDL